MQYLGPTFGAHTMGPKYFSMGPNWSQNRPQNRWDPNVFWAQNSSKTFGSHIGLGPKCAKSLLFYMKNIWVPPPSIFGSTFGSHLKKFGSHTFSVKIGYRIWRHFGAPEFGSHPFSVK
jgi:hypothetical protein